MKPIGIDLGTTNSCIATIENGFPRVIATDGRNILPSVVCYKDGEVIVGNKALNQALIYPKNTIHSVKRLIGNDFDKIAELDFKFQYDVVDHNKEPYILVDENEISPTVVSSEILKTLKKNAEDYLQEPIQDVVITVPAYFNDQQRQETKVAGRLAGLNVIRIINEPTAAALAFGLNANNREEESKIVVFDLGGGTFDVSILEIEKDEEFGSFFKVLSTSGDNFLGGNDFNQVLYNYALSTFETANNIKVVSLDALTRLESAVEKAKIDLSTSFETEINIPYFVAGEKPLHLSQKISRAKYEELCADLLERIEKPCLQALSDAKLLANNVDEVILIGGMTRTPMIVDKVKEIFTCKIRNDINPDESVAIGAAIQADIILNDKDVTLVDVIPLSIGISVENGRFNPIILKNSPIPARVSQEFTTADDNQENVEIAIYQGERLLAKENKFLGKVVLNNIPLLPKGTPVILVTLEVSEDGTLNVFAEDENKLSSISARLEVSGGLTEDEIKAILEESEKKKQDDLNQLEVLKYKNYIEKILFSIKKNLKEEDCSDALKQYIIKVPFLLESEKKDKEFVKLLEEFYTKFGQLYYRDLKRDDNEN